MQKIFNINNKLNSIAKEAEKSCKGVFEEIEYIEAYNTQRMLKVFIDAKVDQSDFNSSTGYGYGDTGRKKLDGIFAEYFGAEDALVRYNFASGTHALTVALFGILRPFDTMLSVTGSPYDTMRGVIGIKKGNKANKGSLKDFKINYKQVELLENGKIDYEAITKKVTNDLKLVYIQRSRGYSLRESLSVEEIEKICQVVKKKSKDTIIMVDNCYGEFVEVFEPSQKGADIIVGSLIKNPGGGITPCGGYIAGKKDLVELCADRLTVPGIGAEIGATLGHNMELFMGIYNAPHATGEALKTAVFTSALFELLGYEVFPRYNQKRADIIQAIKLNKEQSVISFCRGLQSASPIDSFLIPEPWDMPGYNCKVIMASGAFIEGSSIELSADAPLREPYAVWVQGGINFSSSKIGIILAAQEMLNNDLLHI